MKFRTVSLPEPLASAMADYSAYVRQQEQTKEVLLSALTIAYAALSGALDGAIEQGATPEELSSLQDVIQRIDVALRKGNGLYTTTRTDSDVEDDGRAIREESGR